MQNFTQLQKRHLIVVNSFLKNEFTTCRDLLKGFHHFLIQFSIFDTYFDHVSTTWIVFEKNVAN